ncbi:MAG: ergosterol biosynthesis protein [Watsoniomyces obsoletus]|nr:MAG: ergosterol biosynthesis protein [Watsoniomyces obsoletus]
MNAYLPQHEGLLPGWILFLSAISLFNSIQAYSTMKPTKRVYSARPDLVTPLSTRTFGTWTLASAIVRIYAAYNFSDPHMYHLAFAMVAIAFGHFMSEWLFFRTTNWGAGLAGPILMSSGTLVWMILKWDFYVH